VVQETILLLMMNCDPASRSIQYSVRVYYDNCFWILEVHKFD
jgi:hypothetical protein